LLGPATLIFILLDPELRRWLWQPWPYLAAAISAAIFSPVVIWNFLNDWASFSFQGQQRLEQPMHFSLPILLGSILLLLTPVGLVAASRTLFARSGPDGSWLADRRNWLADRRNAFMAIYTLVPLSVFIFFSLFHEVKLNWTGPVWLAILPGLAARLVARDQTPIGSSASVVSRRSWLVTGAVTLLIYGGFLPYLVLGLPGISSSMSMSLGMIPIGWKEFGVDVGKIAADLESVTGKEPLRVGMDRYSLSSEVAFYDPDQDAVRNTAGRSLFGFDSLMYELWFPPAAAKGREIVLVSRYSGGAIANKSLSKRFRTLGPIQEHIVHKGSISVARFFWRIGYGYKPYEP
jgi:dolichol-phosphate mannosyltransferase